LGLRILKELLKSSSKNKESGFELKLFRDVNGLKEVKQELGEIVEYFRNPKIFHKVGAKVPKGIILSGPPGNGKTLLAKSLAGECNVPFIFKSGSEFEEMVVGLGSLRVRELFEEARSYEEGCIIFIDEIDSIGKKRYSKDSHTELTLNQLLNELDGFRQREKVIVIAATNNIEVLDKALLRPGRFDRKIYVPNPNLETRKEIINKNSRKLKFKSDVDLEELSSMTKGLSGAQIFNIFNEVKILMIREGKEEIDNEMVFEAFDRTLMGPS
jgi:ATP-dependent metalloprotease FtsH